MKDVAVQKALKTISLQAEKNAKVEITKAVYDTPETEYRRTGRLRNSIDSAYDGNTAYVGTNVEHAPYVELGTSKMKKRPFIRPAVENHLQEYQKIFEEALKRG